MRTSWQSAIGLALALSIGTTASADTILDCFNDEYPPSTSEAFPESLQVTDADLAWLMRELERIPPATAEQTRSDTVNLAEAPPTPRHPDDHVADGASAAYTQIPKLREGDL